MGLMTQFQLLASMRNSIVSIGCGFLASAALAQAPGFDAGLRARIDAFIETERETSRIPGIALAIVGAGGPLHVRGFGHDGHGRPVDADTPFPLGSLTKSFTALLIRQAIDTGQLGADAPVQRYLPWFRYGEGWFIGPFGAATHARWHLGALPSFAAWMVLLPQTQKAVVLLINANTELPFGDVNAVMSRLPMGVVNLLLGQPAPRGPSLRQAYWPFNAVAAAGVLGAGIAAWRVARAQNWMWALWLALLAGVVLLGVFALGLGPALLASFAPDLALTTAVIAALLCLPLVLHGLRFLHQLNPKRRL
jgi:CubicO group peptidase (beta-lactamase class C family)